MAANEEKLSTMLAQGKGKYRIINVVAKRARQINEGRRPVVRAEGLGPIDAAVAELLADKLIVTDISENEENDTEEEE